METALTFSSPTALLAMLNAILIGVIVYWSTNKFTYIINVIIYAVARSVIPIITTLMFGGILGTSIEVSLGVILKSIFILLILYFILGLLVIKITEKIIEYFNSDNIVYFVIFLFIIESIISWLFEKFLGLII